jgi:hypothetical protein
MAVRAVHYMSPERVRWRHAGWLTEHGPHTSVCAGGNFTRKHLCTHDRRRVTCKRCLRILGYIEEYRASEPPVST